MKNIQKNNKGFTLLEIIIVIIIIGVLASLALPRFLKTVEYSRSAEALSHLSALRQSMDRCYASANTYVGCDLAGFAALDVENPTTIPGSHFGYAFNGAVGATTFAIIATRNSIDGGDSLSEIHIDQSGSKAGSSGVFQGIR